MPSFQIRRAGTPTRRAGTPFRAAALFLAALASLAAVFDARPARASLVLAMDVPDLTFQADRIVVGEVLTVKSAWTPDRRRILSTIEVRVVESWKGEASTGRVVTLVQPGGVVDDIEMRVHGLPAFAAGERAVLFLRGGASPALVGLGQGKRPVRLDAASRRWVAEPGDRSAAVLVDGQGRMVPAAPDEPVLLDELRARVRTLLKR
jgi:hypothetical protein